MQAEAQAQQAQQAVESAPAMAGAAKAASEVNPDQLSEVMAMFQGYGAPTEV